MDEEKVLADMEQEIVKILSNKPVDARSLASMLRKAGIEDASKSLVNKVLYRLLQSGFAEKIADSQPPLWIAGGENQIKRIVLMDAPSDLEDEDLANFPEGIEIHLFTSGCKVQKTDKITFHETGENAKDVLIGILAKEPESVTIHTSGLFSQKWLSQLSSILDARFKIIKNIDF